MSRTRLLHGILVAVAALLLAAGQAQAQPRDECDVCECGPVCPVDGECAGCCECEEEEGCDRPASFGCTQNGVVGTCRGDAGRNTIVGTDGADVIKGGRGNDNLIGLGGNDILCGQGGNDFLEGGAGNDFLKGGGGDDIADGGRGNDYIEGNGGNDILEGHSGRDKISGGNGQDRINGGLGTDACHDNQPDTIIRRCERKLKKSK